MAHLNFEWDYPAPNGITFKLYENGQPIVTDIGQLSFSLLMDGKTDGVYSYYVTSYQASTGLESAPSNTVTVDFFVPAPPENLRTSWSA